MLQFDKENTVQRMIQFIRDIYPLPRMVNSEGMDKAFELVKKIYPKAIIHEYPAGLECGDWIVPRAWKVKEAWLKDEQGKEIVNFKHHPLFVAAYSEPISGWFSKKEIASHTRYHPMLHDAFFLEHRNAYNYKLVDWGITLPKSLWDALNEAGKFHVHIDIEWDDRSMKLAEIFLPGQSEDIISISAHIDELCNDDLSGCAVGFELIRYISQLPERKYSYQLLLVPETIGTFFYVFHNLKRVKKTIGMYNFETVGSGEQWVMKEAFTKNSYVESVLHAALKSLDIAFRKIDFFDGYGNDERVYEWPPIGVPGVALQRYPFREYHSSEDTPENLSADLLYEAFIISKELIEIFESDYVPQYTSPIPPWLSRHDLYYDSKEDANRFHKFNNLVLFNIDGKKKISEIAHSAGLNFREVFDYLAKFLEKGMIKKLP